MTCWAQRGTNYSDFSQLTKVSLDYGALAAGEFCPSLSPGGTVNDVVSVLCNFYCEGTSSYNSNVEFLMYPGKTAGESWVTIIEGSGGNYFLEGCHRALIWPGAFVCDIYTQ